MLGNEIKLIVLLATERAEREAHSERVKRDNDDLSQGFEQGIRSYKVILQDIVNGLEKE